jgi:hypothetical protein
MGRGKSSVSCAAVTKRAVSDTHTEQNFSSVIGDKRGNKQEDIVEIAAVIKPSIDYGARTEAVIKMLTLIPSLPAPQEVPVWAHEGLEKSFNKAVTQPEGRPKTKAAIYKLKYPDFEMSWQIDGESHVLWDEQNPNKKNSEAQILAIGTVIDVAKWLIVFSDLLDSGERKFLELIWAELLPGVPIPD